MPIGERIFSLVFGLLIGGTGIYAFTAGYATDFWSMGGGAVLIIVGAQMLYATWRGKPSWLSRLGPLP